MSGAVGAFPGLNARRRRTVRGPINPADRATIVSIYPKEVDEKKCTISPGRFILKAGSVEAPSVTVVGPSSWWRDFDEEQELLEIPVSAIVVADAIVKDYCIGIFGCDMAECMPGFFYVAGEYNLEGIKKHFPEEIPKAETRQKNWYQFLVKAADSLWARSNGNPLAINDDMRLAAKALNLASTKDWMKDFQMVDMVRCKACGSLKNPNFPICATCRFPDPEHPMTKQLLAVAEKLPKG